MTATFFATFLSSNSIHPSVNCFFREPPDLIRRWYVAVDSGARKIRRTVPYGPSSCRILVGERRGGILERYITPVFAIASRESETFLVERMVRFFGRLSSSVTRLSTWSSPAATVAAASPSKSLKGFDSSSSELNRLFF